MESVWSTMLNKYSNVQLCIYCTSRERGTSIWGTSLLYMNSSLVWLQIGDMISVIDMPPPEESTWWRGKRGFLVGFFPSHCVAVITDKLPQNLHLHQSLTLAGPTKPVLRSVILASYGHRCNICHIHILVLLPQFR